MLAKNEVIFDVETMKKLAETDMFLARAATDLIVRNPEMQIEHIYEVIFNSYIMEDSYMEEEYLNVQNEIYK